MRGKMQQHLETLFNVGKSHVETLIKEVALAAQPVAPPPPSSYAMLPAPVAKGVGAMVGLLGPKMITALAVFGPGLSLTRLIVYKLFHEEKNKVQGKQFLVTGACGALGSAFCIELAKKGAHTLVLWDVRKEGLDELKATLQKDFPKLRVISQSVNLMSNDNIRQSAALVIKDSSLSLDVIVNIAGIVFSGALKDSEEIATMQINYLAQVEMLKIFIPHLEKRPDGGHIVGVASLAAFNAGAGMSSYCASKFALRAYYEGTACELAIKKSNVSLSLFCPGAFDSKLFKGYSITLVPQMNPQTVAKALVRFSVERRYHISSFPVFFSSISLVGCILNLFGVMLIVPVNPLANWKGNEYAEDTLRRQ